MATFNLHAKDLQQSKQLFEEWFDTTGWWNPVLLGERIGFLRDGLISARGGILQASDDVADIISRWEAGEAHGLGEDSVTLLKALGSGLEQLHSDTARLYQTMEDAGVMLMGQEQAKNIYETLRQAMEDLEPDSFDELEQEIKSLVDQHTQDLNQMNNYYQSAREGMIGACSLDEFEALASRCSELEIPVGWSVALGDVVAGIKGLPEDPAQNSEIAL